MLLAYLIWMGSLFGFAWLGYADSVDNGGPGMLALLSSLLVLERVVPWAERRKAERE
jgi:hypothetical protein